MKQSISSSARFPFGGGFFFEHLGRSKMGFFSRFTYLCTIGLIFYGQVAQAKEPTRGEIIYRGYCAVCHGPTGKGDGISAPALLPLPPDLTKVRFKLEKDVLRECVLNGREGTQMEAFREKLLSTDIELVIEHILILR